MKKTISLLLIILFFTGSAIPVFAAPYENYTYSHDGLAQGEPQAYIPSGTITGESSGAGAFNSPKDIFVCHDQTIYIADSGNNRIVVLNPDYRMIKVISGFTNLGSADQFNDPNGVFVDNTNHLYIADTGNQRVVALNADGSLYKILKKPESPLLGKDFAYAPLKVAVDSAERVYIVSRNVNQGMVELSSKGDFWGFFGAVKTIPDFLLILEKMIATKTQQKQMELTVPTEYSSCDIDDQDFIYGTVSAVGSDSIDTSMFVHRLNPMGNDILKRNGFYNPMGDVNYRIDPVEGTYKPSLLCDIAVRDCEMYSVLDNRMGRIFTYNGNGDLMYLFGANGGSLGQFGAAEALDTLGDKYLVVDSKYNWITVFQPTKYGDMVTAAVRQFYARNYEKADALWNEILNYTAKSDLAYKGVGISLIKKGDNKKALAYLKMAHDKKHYSIAMKNYRTEWIDTYFTSLFLAIVALILILALSSKILRKTGHRGGRKR